MKTTTNKNTNNYKIFKTDLKKREKFNSDIEYLAYLYTEHLEVAGNAYIANIFFKSPEFKNLAKI